MRLGVGLGPFYASTRVGGRRRGNGGCLTGLLTLFFLPVYLIAKLYQVAWRKPQTQRGKILSVSGVSVGLLVLLIIGAAAGGSKTPTSNTPSPVASVAPVVADVSTTPSPTHTATPTQTPTHTATPTQTATPKPTHTATPVHTQAPATTAPPPAAPTTAPAAPPAPDTSAPAPPPAAPKAGQFCPDDEHGLTVDGLTCSYYPSSGTWHWKH